MQYLSRNPVFCPRSSTEAPGGRGRRIKMSCSGESDTLYPGTGRPLLPSTSGAMPYEPKKALDVMGQPVSVCHQLSATGMPAKIFSSHANVDESHFSPATNQHRKFRRLNARNWSTSLPAASRMARNAVGAQKVVEIRCFSRRRNHARWSGHPTGLPSTTKAVDPVKRGPYTDQL